MQVSIFTPTSVDSLVIISFVSESFAFHVDFKMIVTLASFAYFLLRILCHLPQLKSLSNPPMLRPLMSTAKTVRVPDSEMLLFHAFCIR